MAKCPWCGDIVPDEEYYEHLMEEHYKLEDGKRVGPYPKKEQG